MVSVGINYSDFSARALALAEKPRTLRRPKNGRCHRCCATKIPIFNALFVLCHITVVAAIDEVNKNAEIERLNNCVEQSHDVVTSRVIEGWPFRIDCQNQLDQEYYFFGQHPFEQANETNLEQCVVTSGGSVVHVANVSRPGQDLYYLYDASVIPYVVTNTSLPQNGTEFTSYLIVDEKCLKTTYTLLVDKPERPETCADSNYDAILDRELVEGGLYSILCVANKDTFHLDTETYEVTWYKDCTKIKTLTKTGRRISGDFVEVDALQETNANFNSTPGAYTCSVTYNGQERHLSRTNVCIKHAQHNGPPAFRHITSQKSKASAGQEATLTCGGLPGSIAPIAFALLWFKNNTNGDMEQICSKHLVSMNGSKRDEEKYQCNLLSNMDRASKCYNSYEESLRDGNRGTIRINSTLTIRNFQKADEGQYICRVVTTRAPVEVTFDVELKSTNVLLIVLPTIIGFLFLVIICLALVVVIRRGCFQHWKRKLEETSSGASSQETRGGIENASHLSSAESRARDLPQTLA